MTWEPKAGPEGAEAQEQAECDCPTPAVCSMFGCEASMERATKARLKLSRPMEGCEIPEGLNEVAAKINWRPKEDLDEDIGMIEAIRRSQQEGRERIRRMEEELRRIEAWEARAREAQKTVELMLSLLMIFVAGLAWGAFVFRMVDGLWTGLAIYAVPFVLAIGFLLWAWGRKEEEQ